MALERRRVHYSGRVQGVGFRYTAQRLAESYAVSGSVRNLSDGRVELEVQGQPETVRAYLGAIRGELGSKIHDAAEEPLAVVPDEPPDRFEILY